mmetsp:Transcript_92228/g.246585  ORF Transcript_92228/g.246585 Transcript_92228/m.246585 type:complete len:940 (-) Transcript_92228:231-3050(-)
MAKRVSLKDDELKGGKGTGDKAGVRLSLGALVGGTPGYLQWSPRAHERRQRNQACLAEVAHAWEAITQGQSTGTVAKSDVEYFFRTLHAGDEDGSPMAGFFDVMGVGAGIEAVRAVGATTGNVVKAVMSETKRRMSALALNAPASVPRAKPGQSQVNTKWPWDPAEQIRRFGGANGESLDREGFEALYMWSEFARPNVTDVFEKYAKDKKYMTALEYKDFLSNSQRELLSLEEVEARIKAVRYIEEPGTPLGVLSSEGFAMLMTLDPTPHANFAMKNSAYVIGRQPAWRCPMDRPLSHYFISSSHNTYLSGNQFNGEVSSAGLLRALKLGVKVLELDCFDGRNEPMVKHGRTMTKQYPFRACVEAIGQYVDEECAKGNIPFPTIITIENHCSPAHEILQAKILRETLGDKLAIPDSSMIEYPSPEDLQGKIIVRDKIRSTSPKEYVDLIFVQNKKSSAFKLKRKALQDIRLQDKVEATYGRTTSDGDPKVSASWLEGECRLERTDSGKAVPSRLNLKRMHMVHARNSDKSHQDRPTSCSKSETKMQKLTEHQPFTLIVYARRNLLRVYPAGNRIMSTNYDPTPAWGSGCQIVALNYQAKDESVWLSNALFRDNGGCGYVLRPQWQLSGAERDVKALALTRKSRGAKKRCSLWCGRSTTAQEYDAFETLRVRVRSAHRCERFFKSFASSTTALKVKFWDGFGGSEEFVSARQSTAPIVDYDMEACEFQVSSCALAFLGFEVQVEGEGAVAQQCVVVGMLRPGLRAVPLAGLDSLPLGGAYLMVELDFPESLQFTVQDSPQQYKIIIPRSFDTPATEFVVQGQTEEDEMKRLPTMTLATDPVDRVSAFTRSMVVAGLTSVLSLRPDADINLAAFVRGMHSLGWTPEETRVTFAALVESPESDTLKAAEAAERVVRLFSGQVPTKAISDACDLSYLNDLVLS